MIYWYPETSPQTSPQISPETSPQTSPQTSPEISPETSPQTSPETNSETSPQTYSEKQKIWRNEKLTQQQITILELMEANPDITRKEIANAINKSIATVKNNISALRKAELVDYDGNPKKGKWVVRLSRDN